MYSYLKDIERFIIEAFKEGFMDDSFSKKHSKLFKANNILYNTPHGVLIGVKMRQIKKREIYHTHLNGLVNPMANNWVTVVFDNVIQRAERGFIKTKNEI